MVVPCHGWKAEVCRGKGLNGQQSWRGQDTKVSPPSLAWLGSGPFSSLHLSLPDLKAGILMMFLLQDLIVKTTCAVSFQCADLCGTS